MEPFSIFQSNELFGFLNAFAMDDFLLDLAMIQLKGTSVACLAFGGKNREKTGWNKWGVVALIRIAFGKVDLHFQAIF